MGGLALLIREALTDVMQSRLFIQYSHVGITPVGTCHALLLTSRRCIYMCKTSVGKVELISAMYCRRKYRTGSHICTYLNTRRRRNTLVIFFCQDYASPSE